MERADVTTTARLAGQVERYHTWPVLRRQSVGEHTWQVMRLWWQLFGPIPPEVSSYILWHDAGELAVGDLPFPVKARNGVLKEALDRMEAAAVALMGGPADTHIGVVDRLKVKACDLLEMAEFGDHELKLGNAYAQPIVDDTLAALGSLVELLPSVVDRDAVVAYVQGMGLRTKLTPRSR